jgi:predicted permease
MEVQTFPMAQMGEEGPLVLAILNTLATLILLLACINVTNLLLARANERARETAVRLALGAPRIRLALQSMWESVILCLLGGGLATGLALWGLSATTTWTRAHLEGNLAFWWNWGFDRTVLLAAGAFVTVAIAVLGGATAIRTANTRFNAILQEGGARTGNRREGRVARGVVVVQVATVSILMFFGSMSAIVARRVATMNLGYDTRNLSSTSFDLPVERYPDGAARRRFFQSFYDRLAARAEIDGVVLRAPLADITDRSGTFELRHEPGRSASPNTYVRAVLGPLTTLGVALREGRSFDSRDHETSEPTAIVSRSFALRYWPGHSPLGRQIRLAGLGATEPWRTVVGVVDDVLLGNPLSRDQSAIAVYVPLRQTAATSATVLFRHRGNPIAGQVAFQQVLADIDPLIAPPRVQSYEEVLAKSTLMANSVTKLFGACFGFALLLAASGTYGLMARSIGRRTREIGVRRALGATDRTILVMLLSQGGRQLGIGAVVALPVMVAIGIGFAHFFPIEAGVAIVTAIAASTFVSTVVLAATWLPTRRAVAIEPRDALWQE